jgi:hypothetical protein
MSAVDTDRMLPLDEVEGWLRDAGFLVTERRRILRSKKLDLADEERNLLVEFRGRYSFIPERERPRVCIFKLDRPASNILHCCLQNGFVVAKFLTSALAAAA